MPEAFDPTDLVDLIGPSGKQLQTERLFQKIIDLVPSYIIIFNLDAGKAVWANKRMEEFVGRSLLEIGPIKGYLKTFVHPDDHQTVLEHRETLAGLSESDVRSAEFRLRNAGGEWRTVLTEDRIVTGADESHRLLVSAMKDITETRHHHEQRRFLVMELDHRVKNTLAIVQSIAHQTARDEVTRQFSRRLMERVQGLVASQDALLLDDSPNAKLKDIISSQLVALPADIRSRISLNGPPLRLKNGIFQTIGMVFHELAANAMSYGSLSQSSGRVDISWCLKNGRNHEELELEWCEVDGPAIEEIELTGFGGKMLTRIVTQTTGGRVDQDTSSGNMCWRLVAPASQVLN